MLYRLNNDMNIRESHSNLISDHETKSILYSSTEFDHKNETVKWK